MEYEEGLQCLVEAWDDTGAESLKESHRVRVHVYIPSAKLLVDPSKEAAGSLPVQEEAHSHSRRRNQTSLTIPK